MRYTCKKTDNKSNEHIWHDKEEQLNVQYTKQIYLKPTLIACLP